MKEKFAVICSILLGSFVGVFAAISLIIDVFFLDNLTGTIIDLIVISVSYMTAWTGIRYVLMEKIANDKMDREWDYKIKPVVNLLADTIGRVQTMEINMMNTNRKIDTTLNYICKSQDLEASSAYIFPGASFKFVTRVLVLIVFTMSALVYVAEYPLSIIHYFILVLYLAWWALLTSEYRQFQNKTAWIWALIPVMTVPAGGIILDAVFGVNSMVGILFFMLFLYAYIYYSWIARLATGFKLLDMRKLHDYLVTHTDNYIQQEKIVPRLHKRWINAGILMCIIIAGFFAFWVFI
ncbi:MAG TPA: hypothetical protein VIO11_07650 [Candidatus Methanoperedens sp.]